VFVWVSFDAFALRAEAVVILMDALAVRDAHIVAWSDVGAAAYYLGKMWPQRCRSITFLGLADRYYFPQPLNLLTKLLWALPIEGLVPSRLLARILARFLGGAQVDPAWISARAAAIPQLARLFKHSVLPNLMEHRPLEGEIRIPCLVVCGDLDALVTVQQAKRMAKLLSNSREALIIKGGEHFLGYVSPGPVNKAIRAFYASLDQNSK